jgi:MscS family membrane protein
VRVRFFRLGSFSLDIEVFAYIQADDWDRFLEIQQEWLLGIMAIVERAGASIALPSQTLHVSDGSYQPPVTAAIPAARVTRLNVRGETAGSGTSCCATQRSGWLPQLAGESQKL